GLHVRGASPPETPHFARAAARATVRFFFLRRLLDRDRRLHAVAAVRAEVLPRGVGNARALVAVGRVRAVLGGRPRLGHRLASRDVAALEVGAVDDDVVRLAPLVGDVDGDGHARGEAVEPLGGEVHAAGAHGGAAGRGGAL